MSVRVSCKQVVVYGDGSASYCRRLVLWASARRHVRSTSQHRWLGRCNSPARGACRPCPLPLAPRRRSRGIPRAPSQRVRATLPCCRENRGTDSLLVQYATLFYCDLDCCFLVSGACIRAVDIFFHNGLAGVDVPLATQSLNSGAFSFAIPANLAPVQGLNV